MEAAIAHATAAAAADGSSKHAVPAAPVPAPAAGLPVATRARPASTIIGAASALPLPAPPQSAHALSVTRSGTPAVVRMSGLGISAAAPITIPAPLNAATGSRWRAGTGAGAAPARRRGHAIWWCCGRSRDRAAWCGCGCSRHCGGRWWGGRWWHVCAGGAMTSHHSLGRGVLVPVGKQWRRCGGAHWRLNLWVATRDVAMTAM